MSDAAFSNISPKLVELPFEADIKHLTDGFVGREWVFAEIDNWVRDMSKNFFILTGEAGVGKSAIAARLTQVRNDIAAYNFCIAGRNSTIVPGTVLRSLAAQLGKKLPAYGIALGKTIRPTFLSIDVKIEVETMTGGQITGVIIDNLTIADPKEEIESLLIAPLSSMPPPPHPIVILLDSLDEAFTYDPNQNLVTLLSGLENLPNWVRVVLTSRPEAVVLSYFAAVPTYIVAADSERNRNDLRTYVRERVKGPTLRERLLAGSQSIGPEELVERIAGVGNTSGLADGNFLYAKILLNEIENGTQSLEDLAALPKSLDEIYRRFLLRIASEWETKYQPLLSVLSAAREPLTSEQLLRFGNESVRVRGRRMNATLVNLALGVLIQFLDSIGEHGQEHYTLFHQSLRDYLNSPAHSGRFACPLEDGHRAIADYYLVQVSPDWSACDRYGLMHLPEHLAAAGLPEQLRALFFDYRWLKAKLEQLGIHAVLADFSVGQPATDHAAQQLKRALEQATHVLAVDKKQFAAQLLGRLMSIEDPEIKQLLKQATESSKQIWLSPVTRTLATASDPLLGTRWGETRTSPSDTPLVVTPDRSKAISYENLRYTLTIWDLKGVQPPRIMTGHTRSIEAIALTPDSRRAVTASLDGTLRVWDLEEATEIHTLAGYHSSIDVLTLVNNGQTAILCGSNNTIYILEWDLIAGRLHAASVFEDRNDSVRHVAFTPDGRHALTATHKPSLKYWNLTQKSAHSLLDVNKLVLEMRAYGQEQPIEFGLSEDYDPFLSQLVHIDQNQFSAIALTPDGRRAIAADKKAIRVWEMETWKPLWEQPYSSRKLDQLIVSPDGNKFASLAYDEWLSREVVFWDTATGSVLGAIRRSETDTFREIALTPDLSTAIGIRSDDSALLVWDLENGADERIVGLHSDLVQGTAISPDGLMAVTICRDGALRMWDLSSNKPATRMLGHHALVTAVAVTPDGKRAVSGAYDGSLKIWDCETGQALFTNLGHPGVGREIHALAILPSGRKFMTSLDENGPHLFDIDTEEALGKRELHGLILAEDIAITQDERWAVFLKLSRLKVWDLKDSRELPAFLNADDAVHKFALMANGKHVVLALRGGTLGIWDISSGEALRTWSDCPGAMSLAVTANDRWIIVVGENHTASVWDATGQLPARILDRNAYSTSPVAVTPDSRHALSVSNGDILRVWDLENGAEMNQWHAHTDEISAIVVTADGKQVVTASWDHTVKLWDLESGEELATFTSESSIRCCAITPDGKVIVAGDAGGQVHILKVLS